MRRGTNWPLILLIWLAGLGAAAQYGKISVIFDRLGDVYPVDGATLGFTVSLVGTVGILLGVIAGALVTRVGMRRALVAGLAFGGVISIVQSTFPPLPLFLITRVIEGAAHLAIVVAAPTLIAGLASDTQRGLALTLWGTFFGVAFAILAWAGLPLVNLAGPGALLLAHGIYMAAMAALLWRLLPPADPSDAPMPDVLQVHLRIYRSPRIGAPAIGWLFYTACFLSFLTLLPSLVPESRAAFVIGAVPLVSIFVSLTLGVFLLRHVSAVTVVVLGFALCAVLSLALVGLPGATLVILGLGAGLGLVQGASFAAVPQLNTAVEDRALANGGLAQMGNLGNTLGTPVLVTVILAAGETGVMLLLAILFAVGAGAHLLLARARLIHR